MKRELAADIENETGVLFINAEFMLRTCLCDETLYGMPIWKHAYHALHSCDKWFINPAVYTEPEFHVDKLDSLDEPCDKQLTREELLSYFLRVREKVMGYVCSLSDESLSERPEGWSGSRLSNLLAQIRHFYAHLGNINGVTIAKTGKWPRVISVNESKTDYSPDILFE